MGFPGFFPVVDPVVDDQLGARLDPYHCPGSTCDRRSSTVENREHDDLYEPPMVLEVGDFAELTRGLWVGVYGDFGGSSGAPWIYSLANQG
jgi:hypothetical protein